MSCYCIPISDYHVTHMVIYTKIALIVLVSWAVMRAITLYYEDAVERFCNWCGKVAARFDQMFTSA